MAEKSDDATQATLMKANDVAMRIATMELIRLIFKRSVDHLDAASTRALLSELENEAIVSLNSRRHFQQANDETENYIRSAAEGYVSRLFASILHCDDVK